MKRACALWLWASLAGCSSINFDYPREQIFAISQEDASATKIGKITAKSEHQRAPGESGFHLLNDGVYALSARLVLAQHAQKTLDVQYYIFSRDITGYGFLGALIDAADRGVRVRILFDDFQTLDYDEMFMALDSHPNISVRVFNPFASRKFRVMDAFKFSLINRRMHNKSLIADNSIAIIGGRNIANEYFGAHEDYNFGDLDVATVGPIVPEISTMFDQFWNARSSLPPEAFAAKPELPSESLKDLRQTIAQALAGSSDDIYVDAVKADYTKFMRPQARWDEAQYELLYDHPDKVLADRDDEIQLIADGIFEHVKKAKQELIVVSPYFVPRREGEALFQSLIDKNVEVKIITNSQAANNPTVAHVGYSPSRKRLLEMGVELYEVKALGINEVYKRVGRDHTRSTLHTKAFMIDQEKLFIGSFNWDQRSLNINTEMGVLIKSEAMCQPILASLERNLNEKTYQVMLDESGDLYWVDRSSEPAKYLSTEPDTSWWGRFLVGLIGILPIDSQL